MKKRTFFDLFGLGVLCLMGLTHCAKVGSENIAAVEFYGFLRVEGNSLDTVTCRATWTAGGALGSAIELTGTDSVTCGDGTDTITLTKNEDIFNNITYEGSGLAYEVGRTYTITLIKAGVSYVSTAVLPAAMDVTAPTENQNITKGSILTVNWVAATSSGVDIVVSWSSGGSSSTKSKNNVSDDGSEVLDATYTTTNTVDDVLITGNVIASLKLTRGLEGTFVASGLKGGSMEGLQVDTVALVFVDAKY